MVDGRTESFGHQAFADALDRPQADAQRGDNLFVKAILPVGQEQDPRVHQSPGGRFSCADQLL